MDAVGIIIILLSACWILICASILGPPLLAGSVLLAVYTLAIPLWLIMRLMGYNVSILDSLNTVNIFLLIWSAIRFVFRLITGF